MGRDDLKFVLENETAGTEVGDKGKTFYRYGLGDFQIWFAQDDRNGNIYAAYMHEREDVQNGLEEKCGFYIGTRRDEYGGYYPNEFQVRPKSYAMEVDEARGFAKDLERACDVMETVKDFFNSGKHFALYAKGHDLPHVMVSAESLHGNYVIFAECYREDDPKQAIEIFKRKNPMYKDCPLSAEFIEIKKAVRRDDLSQVGDELISKAELEEDVFARLALMGLRWDYLGDDWKSVWESVMRFESENGDMVSRDRLLEEVLGQFGCDGAYLGKEYQLLQEAVAMAPATPSGNVEKLLADASQRCSKDNEANAPLQGARDLGLGARDGIRE